MASKTSIKCENVSVPESVIGVRILHWKIKRCHVVNPSICVCQLIEPSLPTIDIKAPGYGWVTLKVEEGALVRAGSLLFSFSPCSHHIVMKDLCAECGANLRREGGLSGERISDTMAKIPMVHAIPELHVSESVAHEIALQDQQSLLAARKLVLLVDLDQTIIHTTNDPLAFMYKDVIRYRLPGSPLVYHTRFRPHLQEVLDRLSHLYQMHICTFGNRVYAHQLAALIDPERRYFSQRILSRDECFNPVTKSANLRALFPRGLNLVCIIDDRGEVWDWSTNLIHVKPYRFFPNIGDINAFPWSADSNLLNKPSIKCNDEAKAISKYELLTSPSASTSDDLDVKDENRGEVSDKDIPTSEEPSRVDTTLQNEESDSSAQTNSFKSKSSHGRPSVDPTIDVVAECDNQCLMLKSIEDKLDSADDDYLLCLQDVLIKIHQNYFKAYETWQLNEHRKASIEKAEDIDSDNSSRSPSIDSSASSSLVQVAEKNCSFDSNLLPHVSDIITKLRATILGPSCIITLSGLSPANLPVDVCMTGRIVHSLGAVLQPKLRLPTLVNKLTSIASDELLNNGANEEQVKSSTGTITNVIDDVGGDEDDSGENGDKTTRVRSNHKSQKYTTHLIACRRGTDKVHTALKFIKSTKTQSLFLLSPQWLWSCYFNWTHMSEALFPLEQDFHPSEFDPTIEPQPGSERYTRRLNRHNSRQRRRHHRHHHHHHQQQQQQCHPPPPPHRTRPNIDQVFVQPNSQDIVQESIVAKKTVFPKLNVSLVQSALDSIHEELSTDRKRKRKVSRTTHAKHGRIEQIDVSTVELSPNTEIGDNLGINVDDSQLAKSVGIIQTANTTESINMTTQISDETLDTDESDSGESTNENEDEGDSVNTNEESNTMDGEGSATATEAAAENSNDLSSELSAYLPPPKTLVLADNPLLHLPPDATGEMLAEIEDAVLEEETELANSLPRETEVYDPAVSSVGLTDSSSSSSSSSSSVSSHEPAWTQTLSERKLSSTIGFKKSPISGKCTKRYHTKSSGLDAVGSNRYHNPNETIYWQVQRELLLRRRYRASPTDLARIEKKLRRIDSYLRRGQRTARQYSTDDNLRYRFSSGNLCTDSDTECESYDADYPKGWSPAEQARDKLNLSCSSAYRSCRHNRRSTSPTIHSDPEPNEDWWRHDDGGIDSNEWNTCPEGYDYEDAEQTRELLFNPSRDRYDEESMCANSGVTVYDKSAAGRNNLTSALFGADDDDDEEDGHQTSDVSDSNDEYEDDEDDADESWDPLREFM